MTTLPHDDEARVSTDFDARIVEGEIISLKLSSTKLLKVKLDLGFTVVRHANRVTPLNDAARKFLGR